MAYLSVSARSSLVGKDTSKDVYHVDLPTHLNKTSRRYKRLLSGWLKCIQFLSGIAGPPSFDFSPAFQLASNPSPNMSSLLCLETFPCYFMWISLFQKHPFFP